jgi:hypothetical protein
MGSTPVAATASRPSWKARPSRPMNMCPRSVPNESSLKRVPQFVLPEPLFQAVHKPRCSPRDPLPDKAVLLRYQTRTEEADLQVFHAL